MFVLALSFVLLTVAFRSVVLPLKAILLNLVSVGAAYGLMVLVFQKGVGNELFGLRQVEAVTPWVPLFLFAVLFGLSMDYHVFLLSRIRERFVQTGDNAGAVAYAVATTARVITGAALIIIAVFAGFASGDLVETQQVGFGVGIALLIDATIVRCVLVPASMKLLGRWNWYLPRWLGWLPEPPRRARARLIREGRSLHSSSDALTLIWRRSATAAGLYASVALGILGTIVAARRARARRVRPLRDGDGGRRVLPDAARPHRRGVADEVRLPLRRAGGLGTAAAAVRRALQLKLAGGLLRGARARRPRPAGRHDLRHRRPLRRRCSSRRCLPLVQATEKVGLAQRSSCGAATTSAAPTRRSRWGCAWPAIAVGAQFGVTGRRSR